MNTEIILPDAINNFPFDCMEIGDSFIYDVYNVGNAAIVSKRISSYIRKNPDCKFSVRKLYGQLRIWKLKGDSKIG